MQPIRPFAHDPAPAAGPPRPAPTAHAPRADGTPSAGAFTHAGGLRAGQPWSDRLWIAGALLGSVEPPPAVLGHRHYRALAHARIVVEGPVRPLDLLA